MIPRKGLLTTLLLFLASPATGQLVLTQFDGSTLELDAHPRRSR